MIVYQLTQSVEHSFHPAITSKGLKPAQMGSKPLSRPRPKINLNNLISTFPESLLTHCAQGKTGVKQERLTRSVPAIGGEGIVCLHLRRKGHYLAVWGASALAGTNDRPRWSCNMSCPWTALLTGVNGRGQDTAA